MYLVPVFSFHLEDAGTETMILCDLILELWLHEDWCVLVSCHLYCDGRCGHLVWVGIVIRNHSDLSTSNMTNT